MEPDRTQGVVSTTPSLFSLRCAALEIFVGTYEASVKAPCSAFPDLWICLSLDGVQGSLEFVRGLLFSGFGEETKEPEFDLWLFGVSRLDRDLARKAAPHRKSAGRDEASLEHVLETIITSVSLELDRELRDFRACDAARQTENLERVAVGGAEHGQRSMWKPVTS